MKWCDGDLLVGGKRKERHSKNDRQNKTQTSDATTEPSDSRP